MNRRHFLQSAATVAGVATASQLATLSAGAQNNGTGGARQYVSWRRYLIKSKENKTLVDNYLQNAAIPALNRAGIKPVGAFYDMPDANTHHIYTLAAFPTLDSLASIGRRLAEDTTFMDAAHDYLYTEKSNPAYERVESMLFQTFAGYPNIKTPRQGDRIFELRTYESHNEVKAYLKVEMFNEAELEIFRKVNLDGVFYGSAMVAPNLPQLTYMLAYKDQAERKKNWDAFLNHPDWNVLKNNDRYKDTVSKITATFLRPAPYSQI